MRWRRSSAWSVRRISRPARTRAPGAPVKTRALEIGLPVAQPTKLKTGEFGAWVRAQHVDVTLVVPYGRILPAGE
jgi:methionyl-tRNA formyltransferase